MENHKLYTPVRFYNFTNESFAHTWNREPYSFPAGSTVYLELWKAQHFAKHLADRELNKSGLPTNHFSRESIEAKCVLMDGTVEVSGPEQAKDVIVQENKAIQEPTRLVSFCDTCDSKGVRHKKGCPKNAQ